MKELVLAAILGTAACAHTPAVPAASIAALREAPDEGSVEKCKYLGSFAGSSSQREADGWAQARKEARAKAVDAGANTVYAVQEWQSPDATHAAVKAYDCSAAP